MYAFGMLFVKWQVRRRDAINDQGRRHRVSSSQLRQTLHKSANPPTGVKAGNGSVVACIKPRWQGRPLIRAPSFAHLVAAAEVWDPRGLTEQYKFLPQAWKTLGYVDMRGKGGGARKSLVIRSSTGVSRRKPATLQWPIIPHKIICGTP